MRDMILELSEPCFGSAQARLQAYELSVARRLSHAAIDMCNQKYRGPPRFRDSGSQPFGFGFCLCERRPHSSANESEPTRIGCPVSFRRPKTQEGEIKHRSLLKIGCDRRR
jgi:hypothetical protein